MPSLILCGQRTGFADDDLRIVCVGLILLRVTQGALLFPVFVLIVRIYSAVDNVCTEVGALIGRGAESILFVYWVLSLMLAVLSAFLEGIMWRTTVRGAPAETDKRALLNPLCRAKLAPQFLLRVSCLSSGIVAMMRIEEFCECLVLNELLTHPATINPSLEEPPHGFEAWRNTRCSNQGTLSLCFAILLGTQAFEVLFALLIYSYLALRRSRPHYHLYNLCRCYRASPSGPSVWNFACKALCKLSSVMTCCLFGGVEAAGADFTSIAMVLNDLTDYGGHIDITFSDILAGVLMLVREQKERREECRLAATAELKQSDDEGYSSGRLISVQKPAPIRRCSSIEEGLGNGENGNGLSSHEGLNVLRISMFRDGSGRNNNTSTSSLITHTDYHFEANKRLVLEADNPSHRDAIKEGAHFMRLAFSIYGYMIYLYDKPTKAPCHMTAATCVSCHKLCRCCCCCSRDMKVKGDTPCGSNEIAFLLQAGLDEACIAHLTFGTGLGRNPYGIVIDHEWKSVVVVIRGTLSMEDALTDLLIQPVELKKCGTRCGFDGMGVYCHSGMLSNAEWLYNDIEARGILARLLSASGKDSSDNTGRQNCSEYQLVITGHSLGAGVAALLSIMLKQKYLALKCLCFSPPGCVLSANSRGYLNAAPSLQDHITSYVLDADIIPRLSLQAAENLRDDTLWMVARIKVPKHEILGSYRCLKRIDRSSAELLHVGDEDMIPDTEFKRRLQEYSIHYSRKKCSQHLGDIELKIPGTRIVHLVKTLPRANKDRVAPRSQHTPVWASPEDFAEILLTGSFFSDHLPQNILKKLEHTAKSFEERLRLEGKMGNKNGVSPVAIGTSRDDILVRVGSDLAEWRGRISLISF